MNFTYKRPTRVIVAYTSLAAQNLIIEVGDQKFDFTQTHQEATHNFPRPYNSTSSIHIAAFCNQGEKKTEVEVQLSARAEHEALYGIYLSSERQRDAAAIPAAYVLLIPYN